MSDPVNAWLGAQREAIERWLAAPTDVAAREQATRFWQSVSEGVSPAARDLAQKLAQLGPHFMAGTGDSLFALFGAPQQPGGVPSGGDPSFGRWLELAPIGYFREHQANAQELARALDEYRRMAERMSGAIGRIHGEALELLAKKTQELAAQGKAVADTRRLYDMWIECGERAFAQQASGEAFGRMQGELVNAATRVRIAQQTIAEYFLKSLDLPTRSELNSVHKRLKEMRERIEKMEAERGSAG